MDIGLLAPKITCPKRWRLVECLPATPRKYGVGTCIDLGHAGTRSPILPIERLSNLKRTWAITLRWSHRISMACTVGQVRASNAPVAYMAMQPTSVVLMIAVRAFSRYP